MKPIYIFCLHGVRTGGPEAIHQLSDALIEQGFDARFVYYDWNQIAALEQAQAQDGYRFGMRENSIEEYAHYKTNVVAEAPNDPNAIIVLPETLCHLAPKFDRATVLIWWLSVDNGFGALSRVNLNHLRVANVKHVTQSKYAEKFAEVLGFEVLGPLTDYTVDLTCIAEVLPWAERRKLILFNANHKVTHDLQKIADHIGEMDPEIECLPVQGLKRSELAGLFGQARVYVDLGSLPGKDRMPREAMSLGCMPIVAMHGAGAHETLGLHVDPRDMLDIYMRAYATVIIEEPGEFPEVPRTEYREFFREVSAIFGLLGCDPDGEPYAL